MKVARRREDMSAKGMLVVIQQDDGDMIVCTHEQIERGGLLLTGAGSGVEFCNSGGHSPETLDALRELMHAMERDNLNRPMGGES